MQVLFGHLCLCPLAEEVSKYMSYLIIRWMIIVLLNLFCCIVFKGSSLLLAQSHKMFSLPPMLPILRDVAFFNKSHLLYHEAQTCITYPSIMQAVQASKPSGIELVTMPPFNFNAFIIGINNHASWYIDNYKNHFSNLKQTKSGTLTKGIATRLEIKA